MLIFNAGLLLDDPMAFVVFMSAIFISLIIGLSFHEASHAYAARLQGDLTATRMGRLTLNPAAHLDRGGTLMLLIVGIGWGKPVPVNPSRLRNGRQGMAFVAVAGPAANFVLALLFASLFQLGIVTPDDLTRRALLSVNPGEWITLIAFFGVLMNLMLGVFNLLPIPPLDGGGILAGIAPRQWLPAVATLQRVGPVILIGIIGASLLTGSSLLSVVFDPVRELAIKMIS
jgi:Zn-dependent protease